MSLEQKSSSSLEQNEPGISFQRTPGTPANILNERPLPREQERQGPLGPGDMETDWAGPHAFPRDSLPHGVGAANSGLRSTNCRSSDAGEVHSLGRNTKGVTLSAEAAVMLLFPLFSLPTWPSATPVWVSVHTCVDTCTQPSHPSPSSPRIEVKNRPHLEQTERKNTPANQGWPL